MNNILEKIITVGFPPNQYYREVTSKNQIVLHHTVSGRGVKGDINWWVSDPKRIATHMIIGHDGTPYQLYSSLFWGHHIGVKSSFLKQEEFADYRSRNVALNKHSIGIEIDSWGPVMQKDSKWYPVKWSTMSQKYVPNTSMRFVQKDRVQIYSDKYRGFYAYEKYTDAQIETVKDLLIYWKKKYNIPLKYNEKMWDVSRDALSGISGVWSHTSYRHDKSDVSPQPELIEMLKSLW